MLILGQEHLTLHWGLHSFFSILAALAPVGLLSPKGCFERGSQLHLCPMNPEPIRGTQLSSVRMRIVRSVAGVEKDGKLR